MAVVHFFKRSTRNKMSCLPLTVVCIVLWSAVYAAAPERSWGSIVRWTNSRSIRRTVQTCVGFNHQHAPFFVVVVMSPFGVGSLTFSFLLSWSILLNPNFVQEKTALDEQLTSIDGKALNLKNKKSVGRRRAGAAVILNSAIFDRKQKKKNRRKTLNSVTVHLQQTCWQRSFI